MYMSFKSAVRQMIDSHFPPEISRRFQLRSSAQLFIPGADDGIGQMQREGSENIHVLFDGHEVIEIPQEESYEKIELWFLRAFRDAIKDGSINIELKREYLSTEEVKRKKKELKAAKHKKLTDSIREAKQNPMSATEAANALAETTRKAKKAIKEGEEGRNRHKKQ